MASIKKASISMLMVGVLAFGILASLPGAQAQLSPTLSVSVTEPEGRIAPQIDRGTVDFTWTYTITGGTVQQALGDLEGDVIVDFGITCKPQDSYIQILSGESVLVNLADGTQQTGGNAYVIGPKTHSITVTPTRTAPGLKPIECDVTATATSSAQNSIPTANAPNSKFSVIPEYYGLVEATVAGAKLVKTGPQKEVNYAIEVGNFGNAETRVSFAFPEGGIPATGNWDHLLPDPILLDARGGEQATKQAIFTISTPYKNGWNNLQGTYTIQVNGVSTDDKEQTAEPVTLSMLTRVRGVYVPALEPIVMVGAILGMALLARSRIGRD